MAARRAGGEGGLGRSGKAGSAHSLQRTGLDSTVGSFPGDGAADGSATPSGGAGLSGRGSSRGRAIPVRLRIAGQALELRRGTWVSEQADESRQALLGKITTLQDEVRRLRSEEASLLAKVAESGRRCEVVGFRNELLTKMVRCALAASHCRAASDQVPCVAPQLAVAQLDAEGLAKDLEKEKLRSEALRWELMRYSRARAASLVTTSAADSRAPTAVFSPTPAAQPVRGDGGARVDSAQTVLRAGDGGGGGSDDVLRSPQRRTHAAEGAAMLAE